MTKEEIEKSACNYIDNKIDSDVFYDAFIAGADCRQAELDKLLSPTLDFDWKQIQFVFIPHQLKNLELFVEKTGGSFYFVWSGSHSTGITSENERCI